MAFQLALGCTVGAHRDCCDACPPPTCTLTGVRTGDDITLNWSTSTTNNETAELRDKFNTLLSTATGLMNSLLIPNGICNGPWVLTVENDCPATTTCTYTPTLNATCDCSLCPGEITTLPTTRPSEVCVPCECSRGQGTALAITISGVQDIHIGPYTDLTWNNRPFPLAPAGCSITAQGCPTGTIGPYGSTSYTNYDGFTAMNGTWVFSLGGNQCTICGAPFRCSAAPEFYKLSATVTGRSAFAVPSITPPCYLFGTPRGVFDYTRDIEIAIGFIVNNQIKPNPSTFIDCMGIPSVAFRIVSQSSTPEGGSTTTASFPNEPWTLFRNVNMVVGGQADSCGFKWTGIRSPNPWPDATDQETTFENCITSGNPGNQKYKGLSHNFFDSGNFRDNFLTFGSVVETSYTTIGWP